MMAVSVQAWLDARSRSFSANPYHCRFGKVFDHSKDHTDYININTLVTQTWLSEEINGIITVQDESDYPSCSLRTYRHRTVTKRSRPQTQYARPESASVVVDQEEDWSTI